MEDVSVSKGVFAHAQRKIGQKKKKNAEKNLKYLSHKNQPWYKAFKHIWSETEDLISDVHTNIFRQILSDLGDFVTKIKTLPLLEDEIPTGILLAGVNLPDHDVLVQRITSQLESVTRYVATIWSRDASSLKHLIEETVFQLINSSKVEDESSIDPEIKKSHSNFSALQAWHQENTNGETPLVIILPDFESFSPRILHDFILILSSHLDIMKFVLIFGVATTLHVVHRSLSYDATSKLKIRVFHTQKQTEILSGVLDKVVFSSKIPFKLTGRAFRYLVDIFLFYDFSVNGFLQCYKICMWRHFYKKNEFMICCDERKINDKVLDLKSEDTKKLKRLPLVKQYIQDVIKTKITEDEFKRILIDLAENYHTYENEFLIALRILFQLSIIIPGYPLGRSFREIYAEAVDNENLCATKKYIHVIKLLGLLSKEELIPSIKSILSMLSNHESVPEEIIVNLKHHLEIIKKASLEVTIASEDNDVQMDSTEGVSRIEWQEKQKMKIKTLKPRSSQYKEAQHKFLEYLDKELFTKYLINYHHKPLHEVFCYEDKNAVYNIIRGPMKAAIHNHLNDPHSLLGCNCCKKTDVAILPSHPDLSIVFKLHLENRKMINLYDLLQSYLSIVDGDQGEKDDVDPVLQARFTRAVAELQFLGFIKATRKKTDHVKRLTI